MVENKIPFPHVKASPNEDERVWAMVCHLSMLFGGIVIPFLILSFKGESSRFIAFHARQATFYQGAVLLLMLTTVGFALFLSPLFVLMGVIWSFKARNGQWASYPFMHRFVSEESLP